MTTSVLPSASSRRTAPSELAVATGGASYVLGGGAAPTVVFEVTQGAACPAGSAEIAVHYMKKYCYSENEGGHHCGGGCTVQADWHTSGAPPATCQYIYRGVTCTTRVFGNCVLRHRDCDGTEICYADADEDGYRTCDGDCDDANPDRNPGRAEICDELDNDCDDAVDEGASCG